MGWHLLALIQEKFRIKKHSNGVVQKLATTYTEVEKPRLRLLDKPTRGTDENSLPCVNKLLLKKNSRGATILIKSHNSEDISSLRNQVYIINTLN